MAELMDTSKVDELIAGAFALPGTGQFVVPEPAVKALLAAYGATAPRNASVPDDSYTEAVLSGAVSQLGERIVLKAWGPGIVHKTELGAVRLGLSTGTVAQAVDQMRSELGTHGVRAAGFLIEEQTSPGAELLLGVVDKPPFGHLVVLGLGGTLTELLDDVVTRLCPITRQDAEQMVGGFGGSALLHGYRTGAAEPGITEDALIELLLAVAGKDGLIANLGPAVAEFECNPVIMNEQGAVIADARLVLHGERERAERRMPVDLDRLFAPRSVAIVGASGTRTTVANRALRRYRERGWTHGLYAIHPTATDIEGVRAYPSVAEVPGGVDYLMMMLPAEACADAVRSAKGHAKFVHVLSSGFGEAGDEGRKLEDDLLHAVREADVRLVGPNSLGVYSPRGRQSFAPGLPNEPGHVGGIFQSGGLCGDVVYLVGQQGVRFSKAVSAGNGSDLTLGELVSHVVDDYVSEIVAVHVEGGADAELIDALRRAKERKPVVLLATGLSSAGSRMAASHTGSLTSDRRSWQAVSASTGAAVVETVEDFIAVLHHVGRHIDTPVDADASSVLLVGAGGGASVLAADACEHAGLELPGCAPEAIQALAKLGFGAGTSLLNPVDVPIFQGTDPAMLTDVVDTVLATQRFSDVLLHVDIATYYLLGAYVDDMPGVTHLLAAIEALGNVAGKGARLSLVARNLDAASGADLEAIRNACASAGLPLHRTFAEAALAVRSAQRLLGADQTRPAARTGGRTSDEGEA